jgi:DNA mismatch endonuclease (patch repair protein)
MKDPLTPQERSKRMSLVRAKNTKPEMRVRGLVYAMGYRYRLHVRELPGCPDMVFRSRRKVIFIHGCFWHQHNCAMGDRIPKSRVLFWQTKLEGNKKRDVVTRQRLRRLGWSVLVVWECQITRTSIAVLSERISRFLSG